LVAGKNCLFSDSRRFRLKLGNFSLSCPLDRNGKSGAIDSDIGAIKQCLPPHLCPPEVRERNGKSGAIDSDIGAIKQCLPPHLCPPEVRNGNGKSGAIDSDIGAIKQCLPPHLCPP